MTSIYIYVVLNILFLFCWRKCQDRDKLLLWLPAKFQNQPHWAIFSLPCYFSSTKYTVCLQQHQPIVKSTSTHWNWIKWHKHQHRTWHYGPTPLQWDTCQCQGPWYISTRPSYRINGDWSGNIWLFQTNVSTGRRQSQRWPWSRSAALWFSQPVFTCVHLRNNAAHKGRKNYWGTFVLSTWILFRPSPTEPFRVWDMQSCLIGSLFVLKGGIKAFE